MFFKCIPTGMFESNSYILGNDGEAVIIDAGVAADEILEVLEKENLTLKKIILTHGHLDHISSVDELRDKTGAEVLIHEEDSKALVDSMANGTAMFGEPKTYRPAEQLLKDGDVLSVGGMNLMVIHTPGHTLGGICIKVAESLFTGDTLFNLSIGRTDLAGGDYKTIIESITKKLLVLEDKTIVYPGHGKSSTIGFESKNNPYLKNN